MASNSRLIVNMEAMGAAFVILAGTLLHFAFSWSGNFEPLALFAPVNESLWEHLKLAFWPGLFWALLQLATIDNVRSRVLPVKGISLLMTNFLIATTFLSYTSIVQSNYLVLDIGIFILAVVAGSAVSGRLLIRSGFPGVLQVFGWILLIFQLIAFSMLTFYPPEGVFFIDPKSGMQGIH